MGHKKLKYKHRPFSPTAEDTARQKKIDAEYENKQQMFELLQQLEQIKQNKNTMVLLARQYSETSGTFELALSQVQEEASIDINYAVFSNDVEDISKKSKKQTEDFRAFKFCLRNKEDMMYCKVLPELLLMFCNCGQSFVNSAWEKCHAEFSKHLENTESVRWGELSDVASEMLHLLNQSAGTHHGQKTDPRHNNLSHPKSSPSLSFHEMKVKHCAVVSGIGHYKTLFLQWMNRPVDEIDLAFDPNDNGIWKGELEWHIHTLKAPIQNQDTESVLIIVREMTCSKNNPKNQLEHTPTVKKFTAFCKCGFHVSRNNNRIEELFQTHWRHSGFPNKKETSCGGISTYLDFHITMVKRKLRHKTIHTTSENETGSK